MKKKLLSVLLSTTLVASLLAGCGSSSSTTTTTDSSDDADEVVADEADDAEAEEETLEVVDSAVMEAPSTDGWDDSMKIRAYSWNDEFGSRLQYVLDAYPEYADYVELVNLGVSGTDGTYQTAIETAMASSSDYPDIFAMDNDVALYFLESDMTMNLEDAGLTDDMYANAYQFTIDYATVDGKLKACTWQAAVGNICYRADIAEEVLGTSDPDEVAEYLKDWDTFFETADLMQAAGYKMTAGADEIKYACFDQQTSSWITVASDGSETLTLDSSVTDFFELSKQLYDGDYTDYSSMWGDTWSADFEGDVFCYFGCTWFVYWCIATDEDSATSTYGDWRVCEGPVQYHWGGTYVAIGADTANPELCAFLIYELCCDADIMYTIEAETLDFVNNKEAVANIIADGLGSADILGGQNPVETWANAALSIDLSNASYLDASLKDYITTAASMYNTGEVSSADEALEWVKDQVATAYDYITVE